MSWFSDLFCRKPKTVITPLELPISKNVPEVINTITMPTFEFDFTSEKLAKTIPTNKQVDMWYKALADNLPTFEITTPNRVASFIAQCGHESMDFTRLHENLNYKASSLVATWPKRFTPEIAAKYERKPEKIANRAYENRMGNGPEASGDGWKYRGRGPIQITGKNNYTACSKALFNDDRLVQNPDLVESDADIAIKSACWFWDTNNLNSYADKADITGLTKKINGGTHGIEDRFARTEIALLAFK